MAYLLPCDVSGLVVVPMLDEPEVPPVVEPEVPPVVDPDVPPLDPEVPLGLVVPPPILEVDVPPVVPDDAAGAEPALAFLAAFFLCLAFCFFFGGVVAPVLSVALDAAADGPVVVLLAPPVVSLEPVVPVELLPLLIDVPGVLLVLPEVDAPVLGVPDVLSLVPDLFCMPGFDEVPELLPVLESVPGLVCASTTEDTDATNTNDNDRIVVFNVMSNSLS